MFDDVIVVSRQRTLATLDEVAALEHDLDTTMPPGYAEFVTTLGLGTFGDSLQVATPAIVRRDLTWQRELWAEYWFWDEALLSPADVGSLVPVATTDTGDAIVVLQRLPGRIFVLPRDTEEVVEAGSSVGALLDWYCAEGLLTPPVEVRWFMSWAGRTTYQNWEGGDGPRMLAGVHELGVHAAVQEYDDSRLYVVPAFGGRLSISTDGRASVRYDTDLRHSFEPVAGVLTEAGATGGAPWGDVD